MGGWVDFAMYRPWEQRKDLINSFEQKFKKSNAIFFNVDIKTRSNLDIFQLVLFKDEHFDQRGWVNDSIAGDLMLFAKDFFEEKGLKVIYRSVEYSKLPDILENGVDVEPTDGTIYCSRELTKVLEYGGQEKVVQVFDIEKLKPTMHIIYDPKSKTEQEILDLQKTYPYKTVDGNGSILLSRFSRNNLQMFSQSERDYCYWIPDDPKKALVGLFLIREKSSIK